MHGYSNSGERTPFLRGQSARGGIPDNPNCDYTYMNGTSSATPTITGVVALILSANPDLGWRDVRDILRLSARKVDPDYLQHVPLRGTVPYGASMELLGNQPIARMGSPADIRDGATEFPMNLGWQKNAAGLEYSDWYGFGVPDAEKAVALAREYRDDPSRRRTGDVTVPAFRKVAFWQQDPVLDPGLDLDGVVPRLGQDFPYRRITLAGTLAAGAGTVEQFQLRLDGDEICLGAVGIAVKSPAGTVSLLKHPNDHFKADGWTRFEDYALGSYAFHGESAEGDWEIFMIAGNPDPIITVYERVKGQRIPRPSKECLAKPGGVERDYALLFEARLITQ